MSLRYKGAVISATPPTTTGGESGVASGSWTLEQQLQAQGAGNWPIPFVAKYIEDVFSTYLYTNNTYPSNLTITNGIDLSGKGGLVWMKNRNLVRNHNLYDTARGAYKQLRSDSTGAEITNASGYGLTAFNADGFSLGTDIDGENYGNVVSWTFRKQPKFFDIVTWSGNTSSSNRRITHNLQATPAFIIIKNTTNADYWYVYTASTGTNGLLLLNTPDAVSTGGNPWSTVAPTSTDFGYNENAIGNSGNWVGYLFASNAGGFGLTGTDNVISCGSFTSNSLGIGTVNLGYEPQWVMFKTSASVGSWQIFDNMRGLPARYQNFSQVLTADTSNVEQNTDRIGISATGFTTNTNANEANIYIAIRRGPMKVPTSGTDVFDPEAYTGTSATRTVTSGFPVDLSASKIRSQGYPGGWFDRLRGALQVIRPSNTDPEVASADSLTGFDSMTGVILGGGGGGRINTSPDTYAMWNFRRAPSFFDEVCYTGNNVNSRVLTHNLGVAPELVIIKSRTAAFFSGWSVTTSALPVVGGLYQEALLESTGAFNGGGFRVNIPSTGLTATTVTLGTDYSYGNESPNTYVMYLFATCAGVSKVGSYTGNGSTQTINCGFTGGARFVLIKRTDASGDWYVYDTARGMTTLTDPYLLLNSTAAESVTLGSVTTVSTGFAVNASILAAINTNGASYIFLAIA